MTRDKSRMKVMILAAVGLNVVLAVATLYTLPFQIGDFQSPGALRGPADMCVLPIKNADLPCDLASMMDRIWTTILWYVITVFAFTLLTGAGHLFGLFDQD